MAGCIPDLERLLQQLHTLGCERRAKRPRDDEGCEDLAGQHPDASFRRLSLTTLYISKVSNIRYLADGFCGLSFFAISKVTELYRRSWPSSKRHSHCVSLKVPTPVSFFSLCETQARAVLFDASKFNARKVQQLADALEGLARCDALLQLDHVFHSRLLQQCLTRKCEDSSKTGCFPSLAHELSAFAAGFDLDKAKKTGVLEAPKACAFFFLFLFLDNFIVYSLHVFDIFILFVHIFI